MSPNVLNKIEFFLDAGRPAPSGRVRPFRPVAVVVWLCCWLAIPVATWAESPGALVGSWTSPAFTALADECHNAQWIFSEDGSMQSISGAQVITGTYRTETVGDHAHILVQTDLASNGEPNCQGVDAEAVLENYVRRAYVVVEADQLTLHMGEDPQAPSFTMTRVR